MSTYSVGRSRKHYVYSLLNLDAFALVAHWSYEEPINWKFIVENYAKDYHFSTAHSQSLRVFDFQGCSLSQGSVGVLLILPHKV